MSQETKQTKCKRRVNNLSPVSSLCLHESLTDDRQVRRGGRNIFIPSLIKLPWKLVQHLHLAGPSPLPPPPSAERRAAEMFYSASCTTAATSSCMRDVESECIWHHNLDALGLNQISFVSLCIPLCTAVNNCLFISLEEKNKLFHNWFPWQRGVKMLQCEDHFGSLTVQIW